MKKLITCVLLFFVLVSIHSVYGQRQNKAYLDYIAKYNEIAIRQQREHGIPASIILAQGLLESGAGLSKLSVQANNHFGIKCHGWEGEGFHQDDDAKNECFRKYKTVLDSYEDHSAFLVNRSRYSSLFQLAPTDYESWAHGLKKAGYATDPNYAFKLISIIKDYELHKYDLSQSAQPKVDDTTGKPAYEKPKEVEYERFHIGSVSASGNHQVLKTNGIRYIIAVQGDTYGSIGDKFNISENKLRRYNEVDGNERLKAGDRVYLQTKKSKAAKGVDTYTVRDGDSMYKIAQDFGIKLESLYKLNNMDFSEGARVGQVLNLR